MLSAGGQPGAAGVDGPRGTFDSFECAIQKVAPVCEHCHCRVIGHGVEHGDRIFCCAHCAEKAGVRASEVNA